VLLTAGELTRPPVEGVADVVGFVPTVLVLLVAEEGRVVAGAVCLDTVDEGLFAVVFVRLAAEVFVLFTVELAGLFETLEGVFVLLTVVGLVGLVWRAVAFWRAVAL